MKIEDNFRPAPSNSQKLKLSASNFYDSHYASTGLKWQRMTQGSFKNFTKTQGPMVEKACVVKDRLQKQWDHNCFNSNIKSN